MSVDQLKIKLISMGNTFLASFILGVATSIYSTGSIEWTTAFWIALVIAGVRAGVAAIVANFVPQRLGGNRR